MIHHHPPRDAAGIAHHPDDELLLAYAGGAADEAVSLIVATHMVYCGACHEELPAGPIERRGHAAWIDREVGAGISDEYDAVPRRAVSRELGLGGS